MFFLFWLHFSEEHHKQNMDFWWLYVFEKRETACIWAPSLCQSMEEFCLLTVLEVLPGLILVPSSERRRKNDVTSSWCYFCSWAIFYSCLKQPKPGAGCKTSPHPDTRQQNTAWNESRKHYSTLTDSPKLYSTLIIVNHIFNDRGTKVSELPAASWKVKDQIGDRAKRKRQGSARGTVWILLPFQMGY